jgi:hypothetical protein
LGLEDAAFGGSSPFDEDSRKKTVEGGGFSGHERAEK